MPLPPSNPDLLTDSILPVEIVLGPSWWHRHEGISFDRDFFFNPARRVEVERQMERALYNRWGRFGLGADHDKDLPVVGAVHLASGFLLAEMLGCRVDYKADGPPVVIPSSREELELDAGAAFSSEAFKQFDRLVESLRARYGYVTGDVNWGGVLNLALDLRGPAIFEDFLDRPDQAKAYCQALGVVAERFATGVERLTGSSSISVNRTVRHFKKPVYLHSECSHTMISVADYERFLMEIDLEWSRRHDCFGVHYCGSDPHRYAAAFSRLPRLAFLDVGWGGDLLILRRHLPNTFLNVRLSPVEILTQSVEQVRATVRRLVSDSANPALTGVCCINMDADVGDGQVTAILETVAELRAEYRRESN